ncbi:MAG: ankyrin repeat domain-containing protein [Candidatus Berkiellales bacterium]
MKHAIEIKNKIILEKLLEIGVSLNDDKSMGISILNSILSDCEEDKISLLLERDITIIINDVLIYALNKLSKKQKNNIIALILNKVQTENSPANLNILVTWLVENNYTAEVVQTFLNKGADCNSINALSQTLLIIAVEKNNTSLVKLLLDHGANINHRDNLGDTALTNAAYLGHIEIAKLLIKHNANTNICNDLGNNAFMVAILKEHRDIAMELFNKTKDISHYKNQKGTTALMLAAAAGLTDMVVQLVAMGANINTMSKDGYTALRWAIQENHEDIVKCLMQQNPNLCLREKRGRLAIFYAILSGNVNIVDIMLTNDTDLNHISFSDDGTNSALTLAITLGYIELIKLLIKKVDINHVDLQGHTALKTASIYGLTECIDILLSNGAKINYQDIVLGRTALMTAAEQNQIEAVKYLLKRGADLKLKDKMGNKAIDLATDDQIKKLLSVIH